MTAGGEFSVYQFFEDGRYEYVRRFVNGEEAVRAAQHYCTSIAAQRGIVRRVIITDGGDCVHFEWKFGMGWVIPMDEVIKIRVEFPDGPPKGILVNEYSWEDDLLNSRFNRPPRWRPVFKIPGYRVMEACNGQYFAMREDKCKRLQPPLPIPSHHLSSCWSSSRASRYTPMN